MDNAPPSPEVSVYGTVNGGADISLALADSAAHVGYESQNQPPPEETGVSVEFVDWPFTSDADPEFADHLAAVKHHRPALAVAPDVEDGRPLERVLEQADQLAEYADDVIVVPKEVHPSEVPDDYRVGIPCADYGSDAPHDFAEYVEADRCHLLGGSPTLHRELVRTYIPVVSADTASVLGGVANYDVWTWPGSYDVAAYQEAANTDLYERVEASYDNIHRALNGAEVAEKLPTPNQTVEGYEVAEDLTDAERTAMLNGRGPPPCQRPDCFNPAESHPEFGTTYCEQHAAAAAFAQAEHERWTNAHDRLADELAQAQNQLPDAAEVATDGGTPNQHMADDDATNTDVPLQKNGWTRESDDPLTYSYDGSDVLKLKSSKHGHGVWFYDEGQTDDRAIRLGFYDDRPAAKHYLNRVLGRSIENLRGEVRQRFKDADDGDLSLDASDVTDAAYPAVKGKRATILARHYDTLADLKDASDDALLALEGIGPKTVEGFRREVGEDTATDDADDDRDLDVTVEPSGITRDDPVTEITGVGPSSDLLDAGFDTVGEWWDGGAPFYGVSGGWQDDALKDLLGAEFVDPANATDLLRIFLGWTNGKVYDAEGDDIGGLPSAMFGNVDWDAASWAWYYDRLRNNDYAPSEMDTAQQIGQFALATGDDIPRDALNVGPNETMKADGWSGGWTGLTGLHDASDVELENSEYNPERQVYTTDAAEGQANVSPETVEFFSTLFATDFTDDAVVRENVELVVPANESSAPRRNKQWVVIFHHPAGDAHAMVEGQSLVGPADFNLASGTYDPLQEWAENAAMQYEEKQQAHRAEMDVPEGLRRPGGIPPRDDEYTMQPGKKDRTDPNADQEFAEQMAGIYDPSSDVAQSADYEPPMHVGQLVRQGMGLGTGKLAYQELGTGTRYKLTYDSNANRYWIRKTYHRNQEGGTASRGNKTVYPPENTDEGAEAHGPRDAMRKMVEWLRGNVATFTVPEEVNGWTKIRGIEAIEYRNAGNTGLVQYEAHGDDTFSAKAQGDATGTVTIASHVESRESAIDSMLRWMKRTEPDGWGLPNDLDLAGSYGDFTAVEAGPTNLAKYEDPTGFTIKVHKNPDAPDSSAYVVRTSTGKREDGLAAAEVDRAVARMTDRIAVADDGSVYDPTEEFADDDADETDNDDDADETHTVELEIIEANAEFSKGDAKVKFSPVIKPASDDVAITLRKRVNEAVGGTEGRQEYIGDGTIATATVRGGTLKDVEVGRSTSVTVEELHDPVAVEDVAFSIDAASDDESATDDETESFLNPDHNAENADNPYAKWSESAITTHSLRSAFDADVGDEQADALADAFTDIRSLAGAIPSQVADVEGVGRGTVRKLWGEEYPDENLTLHHAVEGDAASDDASADVDGLVVDDLADATGMQRHRAETLVGSRDSLDDVAEWVVGHQEEVEAMEGIGPATAQKVSRWADEHATERDLIPLSNEAEKRQKRKEQESATDDGGNDVADQLVDRGINRITANHLADKYGTVEQVGEAVNETADLTDLRGVSDASADEVAEAFGRADTPTSVQTGDRDPGERPGPNGETGHLDTSAETPDPIGESDLPDADETDDLADHYEEAESDAQSEASETADPDPSESKEASADGGGLGWRAKKYLGGAWGQYKDMLKEYRQAQTEMQEYVAARDDGAKAAAQINEVRRANGQDPIDFNAATEDIEGAEGVGGKLFPEDVGSDFSWDADPYDPSKEDL